MTLPYLDYLESTKIIYLESRETEAEDYEKVSCSEEKEEMFLSVSQRSCETQGQQYDTYFGTDTISNGW